MKSVFNSNRHRRIIVGSLLAVLMVAVGFVSVVSVVRGYTFPGGNGGGCTSTWCTGPGNVNAGWKIFALSGGGPGGNSGRGFVRDSPTTWATVQSNCSRYPGITKAYIFVTQAIGSSSPYLGLNYTNGMPGVPGYQDANPGQAEVYYNEAVAYDPGTASGSWGSSVTAFCYYDNPPWRISLTTTVDKNAVEPGERITWTHTLKNEGSSNTNKAITWRYKSSGGISGNGSNWSWGSGAGVGATSIQTSTYDVSAADVGKRLCRSATAEPSTNLNGPTIESTPPTCVLVAKKPKVQVLGSDLIIGRTFSTGTATSGTNTSLTEKIVQPGVAPPYTSNMITGLWPTGVSNSGAKLSPGSDDPHWQLTNVYKANANGTTLRPGASDSHWASTNNQDTCQPGPYPRPATVINTNLVSVGANDAWKTSQAGSAWIGAYDDANNLGNSGSCSYPAMSGAIDQTTFAKASIWVFKLTNDFTIDSCVDPATIRLNMNLSADDEVQILVNGQTIAEPGNFRHYNTWPSTPVSYTTAPSSAFKNGTNTLEIRLKSAWQYTGVILNSISVAQASCKPVVPGNMFGSWVEYGIFATGPVVGTGSGSAFSGAGGKNSKLCDYSLLSFVNATTSNPRTSCTTTTTVGRYVTNRSIPDVAANFPVQAGVTPVFDNNAVRPQGLYTSANNLTIGNATTPKVIAKGQWAIINAPGADVTIAGDITYDGVGLQSIGDIPQLVIIAKNIYINPGVKQVDAWLIAKSGNAAEGIIDTCRINPSYAYRLTTDTCKDRLTVNGPVMAQHLWLRRTAGSGAGNQSGDPAEVFNLRPDAYLWGFARASTSGRINAVYSNELPPRF